MGQTLSVPATIKTWIWLLIGIPRKEAWCGFSGQPDVIETLKAIHRIMNNMGIKIGPPINGRGYS